MVAVGNDPTIGLAVQRSPDHTRRARGHLRHSVEKMGETCQTLGQGAFGLFSRSGAVSGSYCDAHRRQIGNHPRFQSLGGHGEQDWQAPLAQPCLLYTSRCV